LPFLAFLNFCTELADSAVMEKLSHKYPFQLRTGKPYRGDHKLNGHNAAPFPIHNIHEVMVIVK
jgi:hypothetical protein